MDKSSLLKKAETVLEWETLLEVLAKHTVSSLGADRCRTLPLAADITEAEMMLRETREMIELEDRHEGLSMVPFVDLRPLQARLSRGGSLETGEFRQIAVFLEQVASVKAKLGRMRFAAPSLASVAEPLDDLPLVYRAIDQRIDDEGNIRPSATPELTVLIDRRRACRERIRKRLDAMLNDARIVDLLQERYFDMRADRYVLPVRVECQSQLPGIVHDVSASGATVFIEPRGLVDRNNQLKVAELDVEREIRRILQALARQVAPHLSTIVDDLFIMATLDSICAKAAFSRSLRATPVTLNRTGRIRLIQARHPLLVLARMNGVSPDVAVIPGGQQRRDAEIIPNDLAIDDDIQGVVISGPNAGGKTVTLKLVGLFALMVKAGLELPCGEGSDMAFFPEIYADIGDAQDLSRDLSSFSAHIVYMIGLLNEASPGGLVLLDEPATSTDPTEGAALAEALLLRLVEQGLKCVVTTHYQRLKILAQSRPGFLNASAEFDVASLSPTYRVLVGLPGGSSAIDIAGRIGLDEAVLEHARRIAAQDGTGAGERVIAQIAEELRQRQQRLEDELTRAQAAREESEQRARLYAEIYGKIRETEREAKRNARRAIADELAQAKREIRRMLDEVQRERSPAFLRAAQVRISAVEREAVERLSETTEPRVPIDALKAGDRVEISALGVVGVLLEAPNRRRRIRVRVGEREINVAPEHLRGVAKGESDEVARNTPSAKPVPANPVVGAPSPEIVDVRGQIAEDALAEVIASLDRAVLRNAPQVRVIHGHGTGRVKQVLRDYLKSSPYVTAFHPGERHEGGDGVTIVELK